MNYVKINFDDGDALGCVWLILMMVMPRVCLVNFDDGDASGVWMLLVDDQIKSRVLAHRDKTMHKCYLAFVVCSSSQSSFNSTSQIFPPNQP